MFLAGGGKKQPANTLSQKPQRKIGLQEMMGKVPLSWRIQKSFVMPRCRTVFLSLGKRNWQKLVARLIHYLSPRPLLYLFQ